MTNYTCSKCNKIFTKKSHYIYHINRKFSCLKFISNNTPDQSNSAQNSSENEGKQVNSKQDCKNKCNFCERVFSRRDNLIRHLNERCKVKKENDTKIKKLEEELIKMKDNQEKILEDVKRLKEENENYKKKVGTQTNTMMNSTNTVNAVNANTVNGNQHIVNNYIAVLPFGQEDLSKITNKDYEAIFKKGFSSVNALVERVHCDEDLPKNHNVLISNMRDGNASTYNGKKWQYNDCQEILEQIYDNNATILEEKFEELIDGLDESAIRMFKKFLKEKDSDNEKIKRIKKTLKNTLYNNRDIIGKTKKQNEKALKAIEKN